MLLFLLLSLLYATVFTTQCHTPVSGIDKMTHGFNLAYYDTISYNTTTYGGISAAIFNSTCNNGIEFYNPLTSEHFQVPDFIGEDSIVLLGESMSSNAFVSYRDYTDIMAKMSAELKTSALWGLFSESKTIQFMFGYIQDNKVVANLASTIVSGYTIEMQHEQYSEQFKFDTLNMCKQVNGKFDATTVATFGNYFDKYGTHYIKRGTFGAVLKQLSLTLSAYYTTYGDFSASYNLKANFLGLLKASGAITGSIDIVDKKWLDATTFYGYCRGGFGYCPTSNESFIAWTKDSYKNPWMNDAVFSPIYELSIFTTTNNGCGNATVLGLTHYLMHHYIDRVLKPIVTHLVNLSHENYHGAYFQEPIMWLVSCTNGITNNEICNHSLSNTSYVGYTGSLNQGIQLVSPMIRSYKAFYADVYSLLSLCNYPIHDAFELANFALNLPKISKISEIYYLTVILGIHKSIPFDWWGGCLWNVNGRQVITCNFNNKPVKDIYYTVFRDYYPSA